MPIRAYLALYRTRLLWCVAIALLIPVWVVLLTTSGDRIYFSVLWNHACACAPGKGDAFALLSASTFTAFFIGALLSAGISMNATTPATTTFGGHSGIAYLLTRPMRRRAALFAPTVVASLVIAILPALGFAIVFGWMRLVHAPALAFFPQALRLVPGAAALAPNASLFSLLVAAHAVSSYLASVSMGFFVYVLFDAQRWLMLSHNPWVRVVAALQPTVLFVFPVMFRWTSPGIATWLLLIPEKQRLDWHPSALLLLVHYAVPAAVMLWSRRTLRAADF